MEIANIKVYTMMHFVQTGHLSRLKRTMGCTDGVKQENMISQPIFRFCQQVQLLIVPGFIRMWNDLFCIMTSIVKTKRAAVFWI